MKELRCADIGFDCPEVMRGQDEQEVMSQVAQHAYAVHGLTEIDEETGQKIRAQIRDV